MSFVYALRWGLILDMAERMKLESGSATIAQADTQM
jgi:hypothetical protein